MLPHHARVLIVGLGVSGEAAATMCVLKGYSVTITDSRSRDQLAPTLARLGALPITYKLGRTVSDCTDYTLIIRSPGVPRDLPVFSQARRAGVPVWSEIQLAAAACRAPITAITGTNGKTTTTILIGELMRAAGRTTHVAGNIGRPFADVASRIQADDAAVIEVSSAQLEDCHAFAPRTAVITNVRPEHMDHYTWEQYVAAKARIVRNHTPQHVTVANYDDEVCRQIAEGGRGRTLYFSTRSILPREREGVFLDGETVVAHYGGARLVICARRELRVPGALPNLLAMMAVGLREGVPVEVISDAATGYAGREHVIEYVATTAEVDYYNDSKATNPWCTLHALDTLAGRPVLLITGGKDDKRADVEPLASALPGRVRHLITLGESGPRTAAAARGNGVIHISEAASLADAVRCAAQAAAPGDVVLFSPGANSKDMFADHCTRGALFKQQVHLLSAPALSPLGG